MKNNFAYFIVSYGKPDKIPTFEVLQKLSAKYPIYIVIGDDDPQLSKYVSTYDNVIVFNKEKYYNDIDKIGMYRYYNKICTYSRLAIEEFVNAHAFRYIGYLFDDINSMSLRYKSSTGISSIAHFNIDDIVDLYIDLLNSSEHVYITGPPNSAFYMGVSEASLTEYSTRYGNFFIYDITKPIGPYTASVMEDMHIILRNNERGQMSICPFGLQVNCRPPKISKDAYADMKYLEWLEQYTILTKQEVNADRPIIPYQKFTPKIISSERRNHRDFKKFIQGSSKK